MRSDVLTNCVQVWRHANAEDAASSGANREEALGGSRGEFRHSNEVALRSANESVRWLRGCAVRRIGTQALRIPLLDEARHLARILA